MLNESFCNRDDNLGFQCKIYFESDLFSKENTSKKNAELYHRCTVVDLRVSGLVYRESQKSI